jgi:hypothetical protein
VLARLVAHPPDGVRVVALGEHVDYWDGPSWTDRFSAPAFTRRQETYVRRLGLSEPFTPQLVVGGATSLVGGDERAAREAISAAAHATAGAAAVRVLEGAAPELQLEVRAAWDGPAAADVLVAFVQDHARSAIAGGENAGRVLDHVAVVRALTAAGRFTNGDRGTIRVPRAAAEGADRVVVIVQERGGGPVRAVATAELGRSR